MLVAAENPVIVAGRVARTPEGIELLVELAETLQAPRPRSAHFRMNFPTGASPLWASRRIHRNPQPFGSADVMLGLEVPDMWFVTHTQTGR
jgi:acetolactate synthase-1/2/3 large subunit